MEISIKRRKSRQFVLAASLLLTLVFIGLFLFSRFPMWGDMSNTTTVDADTDRLRLMVNMDLAPDLEGAVKVIQEIDGFKRVTYEAVAGNPYGAAVGDYLGEYKKEVTFLNNEMGGVALIPKVVEKRLLENRDAIVIPVDITEINDTTEIKLSFSEKYEPNLYRGRVLIIDCNGKTVSLSNLITDQVVTNQHFYPPERSMLPDYLIVGIGCLKVPERYLPTILGDFDNRRTFQGIVELGQKLVSTDKTVGVFYTGRGGITYRSVLDFSRMDNSFIFLIDID